MKPYKFVWCYWFAKSVLNKLGLWGVVAIFIALIAYYVYWQQLTSTQLQIESLQAQLQQVQTNQQKSANIERGHSDTQHQFVENAQQKLIGVSAVPDLLKSILEVANNQKIALNEGRYLFTKVSSHFENQPSLAVSRYEMHLPIKAEYQKLRDFLSEVLHSHPMLGVSKLQFKRENVFLSEVEAELVFVIFVKE
jgi:hypothetical protein